MTMIVGGSLIAATACRTQSGTGAGVGAVGGGLLGAAVGGKTGLLVGAAAGGLLGYGIGRSLEEEDQRRIVYSLETNEPTQWQNPNTGYQYQVQPLDTYTERGRECRQFQITAEIEQRPEQVYGTACRHPNGAWEIIRS